MGCENTARILLFIAHVWGLASTATEKAIIANVTSANLMRSDKVPGFGFDLKEADAKYVYIHHSATRDKVNIDVSN